MAEEKRQKELIKKQIMEDRATYNEKKGISPRAKEKQTTNEENLTRWKEIEALEKQNKKDEYKRLQQEVLQKKREEQAYKEKLLRDMQEDRQTHQMKHISPRQD